MVEECVISIVIPFKSGKQFLLECINSIIEQEYPHWEIILLTDIVSNNDGAIDAVKKLNSKNIFIKQAPQDIGINENWSRIKDLKLQKYMTILGYDDKLNKNFLKEVVALIREFPTASLYQTHFNYIDGQGKILKNCLSMKKEIYSEELIELILKNSFSLMASGFVFKTDDYIKIGGIPCNYNNLLFADAELFIKLASLNKLIVSSQYCFFFRKFQSTTENSNIKTYFLAFKEFLKFIIFHNTILEQKNKYHCLIKKFIYSFVLSKSHKIIRLKKIEQEYPLNFFIEDMQNLINDYKIDLKLKNKFKIKFVQLINNSIFLHTMFLLYKKLK